VKLITTWPVEVSDGVPKFWFEPLFGHSIAWPPEAAASFTTTKGANVLWPDRLSSSTTSEEPPLVLEEELELLELEELLLELLLDEDELELLELDELEELLLDEDELELLELDEELLEEELLELDELEELLEVVDVELPVQVGAVKLPSCVPWKPNTLLAVAPGAGNCQLQQLVNWKLVPGLAPVRVPTFHWLVSVTCSGKLKVTVQLLSAVVPVLVMLTSSWNCVPPVLDAVAVQLCAANA
jgi:hypothetical protein